MLQTLSSLQCNSQRPALHRVRSSAFQAFQAAVKQRTRGCCREYADSNLESDSLYDEIQKSADFGRRKILRRCSAYSGNNSSVQSGKRFTRTPLANIDSAPSSNI